MSLKRPWLVYLAMAIFAFATRIPAFLSQNFYMDGDESIVGIMTLHFAKGMHVPGMFYGQSYGLSFFETLVALLGQLLAPGSIYLFKGSILVLYIFGLWFLWLYLERRFDRRLAVIGCLMLLLMPGWYLWSMKGRGGYVTAFTFFNILLFLTDFKKDTNKGFLSFLVGTVLNVIFLSQSLWLVGTLPFLYQFFRKAKLKGAFSAILGFLVSHFVWKNITYKSEIEVWQQPPFKIEWQSQLFRNLLENFKLAFGGNYHLNDELTLNGITSWVGWFGWVLIITVMVGLLVSILRKFSWFKLIFIGGILASMLQIVITGFEGPRYYIPVLELIVLGILMLKPKGFIVSVMGLFVMVFFTVSSLQLLKVNPIVNLVNQNGYVNQIKQLSAELEEKGISATYSSHHLLQWQIIFASNERIKSRWVYSTDRWPDFAKYVDKELLSCKDVALIGFYGDSRMRKLIEEGKRIQFNEDRMFYYWINSDKEWLQNSGFEIYDF